MMHLHGDAGCWQQYEVFEASCLEYPWQQLSHSVCGLPVDTVSVVGAQECRCGAKDHWYGTPWHHVPAISVIVESYPLERKYCIHWRWFEDCWHHVSAKASRMLIGIGGIMWWSRDMHGDFTGPVVKHLEATIVHAAVLHSCVCLPGQSNLVCEPELSVFILGRDMKLGQSGRCIALVPWSLHSPCLTRWLHYLADVNVPRLQAHAAALPSICGIPQPQQHAVLQGPGKRRRDWNRGACD